MVKIAIVGYGKMGRAIEQIAKNSSISVSRIIDNEDNLKSASFAQDEVAIEFTTPSSCIKNVEILAKKGVNIVCGTTGWYDDLERFKKIIMDHNVGFIYSSNFSVGVNIFWQTIAHISKLMNKIDDYDVMGFELHHKHKKDSPSGTAIQTGEILLENLDRKTKLVTNVDERNLLPEELHFSAVRGGEIIGKHTILFDSIYDSIEISHTSKSRDSYAIGAIKSAQWLHGKKGFFEFQNYMGEISNVKI